MKEYQTSQKEIVYEIKMESNVLEYDHDLVRVHADICEALCQGALSGTDPARSYR
jgi:hypothetical protein